MPNIFKFSNAGGFTNLTRYPDMLAGNTVWNPYSPTGAYDALATVILTGTQSTITFSGIPNTYTHLQLRSNILTSTTGCIVYLQMNGDATSGNYIRHNLTGQGTSASAGAQVTSQTKINIFGDQVGTGNTSTPTAIILDLLDYGSSNKNKTIRALSGSDQNGGGEIELISGAWLNSTTAVNSLTITTNSTSFATNSTFSLYGVK